MEPFYNMVNSSDKDLLICYTFLYVFLEGKTFLRLYSRGYNAIYLRKAKKKLSSTAPAKKKAVIKSSKLQLYKKNWS